MQYPMVQNRHDVVWCSKRRASELLVECPFLHLGGGKHTSCKCVILMSVILKNARREILNPQQVVISNGG